MKMTEELLANKQKLHSNRFMELGIFMEWKNENMSCENVFYWSLFLNQIYPFLRYLTFIIRSADVLNRAIPLVLWF